MIHIYIYIYIYIERERERVYIMFTSCLPGFLVMISALQRTPLPRRFAATPAVAPVGAVPEAVFLGAAQNRWDLRYGPKIMGKTMGKTMLRLLYVDYIVMIWAGCNFHVFFFE